MGRKIREGHHALRARSRGDALRKLGNPLPGTFVRVEPQLAVYAATVFPLAAAAFSDDQVDAVLHAVLPHRADWQIIRKQGGAIREVRIALQDGSYHRARPGDVLITTSNRDRFAVLPPEVAATLLTRTPISS